MIKRSKNSKIKENFYFTIFYHIREGLNPKQICRKYNISKQRINYYLRVLKAKGLIEKIGYGVWKTSKNFNFNTLTKRSKNNIRSHAFIFSLSLPKINNWEKREEYMKKKEIEFKTFKNRFMHKIIFRSLKIQLSNKKIVVYFPKWRSYFVRSAREGYNYSIYDFKQVIIGLERLFNTSFRINKRYKFKVCRQHQALIRSELAKMYNRKGEKLHIRDKKGYLWLLIDNSQIDDIGLDEEECVYNKTAIEDSNLIKKHYNELRETKLTPKTTLDMINKVTANQMIFDKNMSSHLEVLNKIGDRVDDLGKGIKEMTRYIKELKEK